MPHLSRYPDRLVLTRPSTATQDPTSGVPTEGSAAVLYDGPCDAQDMPAVLTRDVDGLPMLTAEETVFLPWDSWIASMQIGDVAAVTFADGATVTARVVKVRHLDRTLLVGAA